MAPDPRLSRRAIAVWAGAAALAIAVLVQPAGARGDTGTSLDPAAVAVAHRAGCQAWLDAHPGATGGQATRMRQCVTDETAIIAALTPLPSPTPSQTPTPSPTPTVGPTTPPPASTPPPSPSPSPTPTAGGNYPTATNRGVPFGTALTVDTRCYLSTTDEVIVAKHFTCPVQLAVTATNVTIRDSLLDNGINNWTAGGGHSFALVDSTVARPSGCSPDFAVGATDYTATRIKVVGFSDGLRLSGRTSLPITVTDSYIETCRLAGAHSDGVQGNDNLAPVTLQHNTIDIRASEPDYTASIFFPTYGALSIVDNVLAGGGWVLQIDNPPGPVITDNKIVDGSWQYNPVYVIGCQVSTWSGNVAVNLDLASQPGPALRTVACA